MTFQTLSQYLEQLEHISARLEITRILADMYQQLDNEEREVASYLLQGRVVPAYESLEFQLSSKMVLRALARVGVRNQALKSGGQSGSGATLFGEEDWSSAIAEVTQLYKQVGDLGMVAAQVSGSSQAPAGSLSILAVFHALKNIALVGGSGSQEVKLQALVDLLNQAESGSAKFIIRIVMGQLRLGFSTMTMLDALSWAATGGKSERVALELAYQKKADIGKLARAYLAEPDADKRTAALEAYTVEVGVPVVPALCQRLNTAEEVIAKMTEVLVEPKFDGVRVQIHFQRVSGAEAEKQMPVGEPAALTNWSVKTFTRSLEENSHQFPELQQLSEWLTCDSCVLDGEAIGYDKATGKLLPFQETITRKRKHEVTSTAQQVPLRFYIFDVLSIDGRALLDEKLQARKELLKNIFKENEVLKTTPYIITHEQKEIQQYHTQNLSEGLEGVVMKQVNSPYQSGRKGWQWVKMKEAEGTTGKLRDTLDCIVMGYYVGRGKRTQFGVGAFLVGIVTEGSEKIKTIAKIGTGLSDDQFRELKQRSQPLEVNEPPVQYQVAKGLLPDVWLSPGLVVEIAADELTNSPTHSAGWALRFPRLVRFRDDKNWPQATSLKEVVELQKLQYAQG